MKRIKIFEGYSNYAHTVDVSQYKDYKKFTLNNFCISDAQVIRDNTSPVIADDRNNIMERYDAEKGILYLNRAATSVSAVNTTYRIYLKYNIDLINL